VGRHLRTLVTQFEKAEQNMPVKESGRISDAVNRGSNLSLAPAWHCAPWRQHPEFDFVPRSASAYNYGKLVLTVNTISIYRMRGCSGFIRIPY
jgi:hypothetical protein